MTEQTKKICIIEDEVDIVEALEIYLEDLGYLVTSYNSAEEFFSNHPEDFKGLYLVDWNLPGEPGINIVKRIREGDKISPVFMISAYNKKDDIVRGLNAGADDYITKPFSLDELEARIANAHQKFSHHQSSDNSQGIRILPEASAFIKEGKTVNLTTREFIIFNKLYHSNGEAVTRQLLIEEFPKDDKVTVRNIDVHVYSLRKKIKEVDFVVETVWGTGYKLVEV